MSCDPCPWARSRSWCTSWKSLVASAVDTTRVGVTGRLPRGQLGAGGGPAHRAILQVGSVVSSSRPVGRGRAPRRRRWRGPREEPVHAVGDHPHPFLELDERDRQRQLASPASSARGWVQDPQEVPCRAPTPRRTLGRRRGTRDSWARRVSQDAAGVAPLDPQLAGGGALPEVVGVLVAHRAGDRDRSTSSTAGERRGLNFSTRNDIVATSSRSAPSPTHQEFSVVTK